MFRHRGKSRTLAHNLRLASLLSFVAGIVNVSGLFALQRLTTNVTGHFAFFAEEMVKRDVSHAWIYLCYILAFLFGAFCSNTLVELVSRVSARWMNTIPVGIEISILFIIALLNPGTIDAYVNLIACLLLFAMGLQNALVTSISNAIVRTTHLTGLFTDLGIELSQMFFYRKEEEQAKLRSSIKLRVTIICFFFLGGLAGGVGYYIYSIRILLLAVVMLIVALIYDSVRIGFAVIKRKYWG
jgi:uncharacterized membrane protein YoaK (UPF0700 family)